MVFSRHLLAVLALGIISQVVQIVFLRELLMVFHGNELSLGIILAAWMLWVGGGSRIGAGLAKRYPTTLTPVAAISAAIVALSVLSALAARLLRGFFAIDAGATFSVFDMALSCVVVMAPTGLLLGVQFVLLAQLWRESDGAEDTSGAEKTYIGEAAGNIAGGILFSFLLVHVFNSFQAVLATGALMVAAIAVLAPGTGLSRRRGSLLKPVLLGVLGVLGLIFAFLEPLDRWAYERQWQFFSPEYELVETRQSRYGTISAAKREDQYSFFQSGNLVFSSAGPEVPSPAMEEQEAIEFAHFSMVQHPKPKRVLLIGGGMRGTAREIAAHPVEQVDYLELDPVLTDTARPYLHESTIKAIDGPRVTLIHTDGRLFLKQTDNTYDMILIDVPDPATAVLNRYYTEEFFREARSRLNPGGVFVTGVQSTADMRGEAIANRNTTIYHTLKRVFPEVLPAGQRFLFFFAGDEKGRVSVDPAVLTNRYNERNIDTEGFSPRQFDLLLEDSQLRRVNWIVRNHGRSADAHLGPPASPPMVPASVGAQDAAEGELPTVNERFFINSDFKPIGYYYTLRFWEALTRGKSGDGFKWILHVRPWWVMPPVAACLALTLLFRALPPLRRSRTDERLAVLLAIFTTGLSTMALQIALIFSFQSLYGFVYEMIGLITALFMGGLAAGTLASRKLVRKKSSTAALACVQFMIALFAVLVAVLLPYAGTLALPWVVLALVVSLTFFSGMLNGADFPLSAACCQSLDRNPEKATGTVYGVELFGACVGALAASVVIAPVLGIAAVCMMAAAANFTAFAALVMVGVGRNGYKGDLCNG